MGKGNYTTEEMLTQFVKHKNGIIFQVLSHKTKNNICFLRRGNKYVQKNILEIKQGLVDGLWFRINEHELSRFLEEDNERLLSLTRKMVNRTIHAQALLVIDDELVEEYSDDNRMKSVLTRSSKEIERVANKMYDRLYKKDEMFSYNFFEILSRIGNKVGGIDIIDMPYLEKHIDSFIENIEEHRKGTVYFKEIQD